MEGCSEAFSANQVKSWNYFQLLTPGLQVTTKTVAQCVEFYYTYKKQVKIGRSGTLVYGVAEPPESRTAAEDLDLKVGPISASSAAANILSMLMQTRMFSQKKKKSVSLTVHVGQQGSHTLELQPEEDSRKWEGSPDRKPDVCPTGATHTLQSTENVSVTLDL